MKNKFNKIFEISSTKWSESLKKKQFLVEKFFDKKRKFLKMDHNLNMHHNNAALHWSYGAAAVPTTPQNHWVPPPQQQSGSLKRTISESDCEDLYSEESSKEQYVFFFPEEI